MSITSEVDHAMTRAIEENDVTALGVVLELRPEVDRALSNLSLQGADGPSGVRPLQLACHKASWACALELVRRGADGIGCADADGDAPLILAFAKGGAEAWTVASAIMAAEAERAGVPEPMDDHTAQYLAAQQAPRRRVVGEKVEMGTAKELWTRVSNKGLSLHTVFFTKLHEVGPHTPGLVNVERILKLAARCGLPIPTPEEASAHNQFAWMVNDMLEPPGAPAPLAVLVQLGLTGAFPLDVVYSRAKASVWHIAANSGPPSVVAAVAVGGRDGIDTADNDGHAPLELACYGNGGDEGTAAAILAAGANPDRHCTLNNIHPLELALTHRNWLEMARAALAGGATLLPDIVRAIISRTQFHALEVILETGGHLRQPADVVKGWLMDTINVQWAAGTALLLAYGVDADTTDDDSGRTILHTAALRGALECCKMLVAAGASVTAIAPTGVADPAIGTPLLFAINGSEWPTAGFLNSCPEADATHNDGRAASGFVPAAKSSAWREAVEQYRGKPAPSRRDLDGLLAAERAKPSPHQPKRSQREEARRMMEAHTHQAAPQPAAAAAPPPQPQARPRPQVPVSSPEPSAPPPSVVAAAGGQGGPPRRPRPPVAPRRPTTAGSLHRPPAGADESDEPVYVEMDGRVHGSASLPPTSPSPPRRPASTSPQPRRMSAPHKPRAKRCGYPASSGNGNCLVNVPGRGPHCPSHTCTTASCTRGKPSRSTFCSECEAAAARAAAASSEADNTCVVCMENPKTALLQHGTDGHLCCCMDCAKMLQVNGNTCPMCRQPIAAVIQVYS